MKDWIAVVVSVLALSVSGFAVTLEFLHYRGEGPHLSLAVTVTNDAKGCVVSLLDVTNTSSSAIAIQFPKLLWDLRSAHGGGGGWQDFQPMSAAKGVNGYAPGTPFFGPLAPIFLQAHATVRFIHVFSTQDRKELLAPGRGMKATNLRYEVDDYVGHKWTVRDDRSKFGMTLVPTFVALGDRTVCRASR